MRVTIGSKGLMPFRRSVSWFAVLLVAACASWLCAAPLIEQVSAAGPLERRAKSVTAQNRVPRLMRAEMPLSPFDARPIVVALRVTLDEQGRVEEVRPLGPGREAYSLYVSRPMGGVVWGFMPVLEAPALASATYDAFVSSAIDAVRRWQYEPPLDGPLAFDVRLGFWPASDARLLSNGVTVDAFARGATPVRKPPPPNGDLGPDWTQGAVRVGNQVNGPLKVTDVAVVYPPIAQSARIQGTVTLDVRVERNGRVSDARIVEGPPVLWQAAFDAVLQWEFTPPVLNGKSVAVIVTTTMEFVLGH